MTPRRLHLTTPQMSCDFRSAQEAEAPGCSTPPGKANRCVFQPGLNDVLVWCSDDGFQLLLYLQNFLVLFQVSGDFFSVAIASWIHSYFDNVMTKFMINNRTDA